MVKEAKEQAKEPVSITLPPGVTEEVFLKFLDKLSKPEKPKKKDDSIVFQSIEDGPEKELRISRDTYKGRTYNSIRGWYTDQNDGILKPGKGCTFKYEQIDGIIEGLQLLKDYMEEHPEEED